uniref:Uncharacterized protein n=1 Tax=Brassica oleracea TaxID=3712 RepID=A0A3P6G4Y8_BRAOL|nr:unnamed protein product [Brassica oleracea]
MVRRCRHMETKKRAVIRVRPLAVRKGRGLLLATRRRCGRPVCDEREGVTAHFREGVGALFREGFGALFREGVGALFREGLATSWRRGRRVATLLAAREGLWPPCWRRERVWQPVGGEEGA